MSGWWLRPHIRTCAQPTTREHAPNICRFVLLLSVVRLIPLARRAHVHALAPWPARHLFFFFLHARYSARAWPPADSRVPVLLLNVLWCFFLAIVAFLVVYSRVYSRQATATLFPTEKQLKHTRSCSREKEPRPGVFVKWWL